MRAEWRSPKLLDYLDFDLRHSSSGTTSALRRRRRTRLLIVLSTNEAVANVHRSERCCTQALRASAAPEVSEDELQSIRPDVRRSPRRHVRSRRRITRLFFVP